MVASDGVRSWYSVRWCGDGGQAVVKGLAVFCVWDSSLWQVVRGASLHSNVRFLVVWLVGANPGNGIVDVRDCSFIVPGYWRISSFSARLFLEEWCIRGCPLVMWLCVVCG